MVEGIAGHRDLYLAGDFVTFRLVVSLTRQRSAARNGGGAPDRYADFEEISSGNFSVVTKFRHR